MRHFDTPEAAKPLIHCAIALAILETLFVVLYFVSTFLARRAKGIEVWCFIPLAYISCIALCANSFLLVELGGSGRHTLTVFLESPGTIATWFKLIKAEELLYQAGKTSPRLAILCLYLKIFNTRNYRNVCYGVGILMLLAAVSEVIASLTICRPLAYFWDKSIPNGRCGDIMTFWRYVGVANLTIDIAILVLPMPAISKLQVDVAVKIGLFITFLCAGCGFAASLTRLVSLFLTNVAIDPLYNCVFVAITSAVEPGMYLMAACMPSFRSLKRQVPGFRDISVSDMISSVARRPTLDSFKRVWTRLRDTSDEKSESVGDKERKITVHTVHTVSTAWEEGGWKTESAIGV